MTQSAMRFRGRRIRAAAGERGFIALTGFMRDAVELELTGDENRIEQRFAATLE